MVLNIENIPFVVITNGETDKTKAILEALEKNTKLPVPSSQRELVMHIFLLLNHKQKGTDGHKGIRELAKSMHRALHFSHKQDPTKEMSRQSIETELFNIIKFLKEESDGTDRGLEMKLLGEIMDLLHKTV